MENTEKRLYIVSFGHSDSYEIQDTEAAVKERLSAIEKELNSYLGGLFPEETFAYYTTPRVTEVESAHAAKYKGYPRLDAEAVESIKKVLATEVRNMNDQKELNSDAPFANVNPGAAGLTGII
ncbi:MAG: hypothetical protein K2I91_06825 [Muribaculaceae bacterium]|nr:hypothetical protein [Muribaculaceae bacterium]